MIPGMDRRDGDSFEGERIRVGDQPERRAVAFAEEADTHRIASCCEPSGFVAPAGVQPSGCPERLCT